MGDCWTGCGLADEFGLRRRPRFESGCWPSEFVATTHSLNAIVQQMAPIWTGSEWTAPQPVRHPAWLYLAALRGSHLRRPVPDSRIDLAGLKAWADEEPHWTCDYVIDAETRTAEVLDIIAASGRARRALTDLQYSIIRDGAAGPVRQMFSPRNSWGFKGSIAFPRPIHALRCMVRSERLDWELDEVTVFADGHDETTATEYETLEIPGVVVTAAEEDEGNAWRLGRYHLAQAILRPETYEWHADWEHMRVTRGDKVQLVHDVPLIGVGAARVTAIEGRRNILPSSSVLGAGWGTAGGAALTPHAGGLLDARYTVTGAPNVYQNLRVTDGIPEHDGVYCISMIGALGPDAGLAEFIRLGDARNPSTGLRYYIEIDQASGEIIDSVRVVDAGRIDLGAGVYRWWLTVDTDEPRSRTVSVAIGATEVGIGADLFFLGPVQAEKGSAPTPVQTVSDDAAVRALTLDEFYDFASADFRLTVRHEDGARSTFTARSPVDQSSRQWTATEPPVAIGDLVFIEELAQESMEVLVTGIYPDGDNARITAVPAAPAVLQADQGEIPHYRPIITPGRDSALRGPELPIVLQAISDETTMLTLPDGTIQPRIAVTLEPITTAGELGSVQLRWRLDDGDDPWTYGAAFPVGGATFLTEALQRGATYEVSVRVIGSTGRSRGWVDIGAVLAQGTEAPPPDVTGFVVAPVEQQVQLRWDDVEGIPDIAWAEIRYAAAEGATWNTSVLQERVSYPMTTARLFARPGTYLIKWMDWGGRYSSNAAAVYVSRNKIRELNAVEVLECSPDWSGTFDGTLATGEGALVLEKSGDEYPSEGMWTSTTTVDLGAVYPVQITPHIEATGFSALDAMSEWVSLAALPSLASSNPDTWRVDTEVRTSENGVDWTAWQPVSGGDFVGRHFNFRVRLRSDREDVTPRIDMLAFVLDMPDRVDGIEDVPCPAAGMRISYDPAFRNVPSVVVTPRDAPSGARVEISNKSRGGFDIRFYNSTGTAIAQRFDWVARGYGREVDE